jgi:hypothetical protein
MISLLVVGGIAALVVSKLRGEGEEGKGKMYNNPANPGVFVENPFADVAESESEDEEIGEDPTLPSKRR